MRAPLNWMRSGQDWPNRSASCFVTAAGFPWHVQKMGEGPAILLLHGTGASAHSWRDVMPLLAENFTVIAPDLPGHAFSGSAAGRSDTLQGMARALGEMLEALDCQPVLLAGHSAGAALAFELNLRGHCQAPIIGFGPALVPFSGLSEYGLPLLAKLLFVNPFVPRLFSRVARGSGRTDKFLQDATGSKIDSLGERCYTRLFEDHRHCRGALSMMASWDLSGLKARLPQFSSACELIHGTKDKAIKREAVEEAAQLIPNCSARYWEGLGHLAHEEDPQRAADAIRAFAAAHAMQDASG
jgi:magnesium chelatase accessory protein